MKRLLLVLFLIASPVWAIDPADMLSDPSLEARAVTLDKEIRCVQCRSEAIASSNADWARDARLKVRELLLEGASDGDVKSYFLERYGEYVLLKPSKGGSNLILWFAGPMMLILALGGGGLYLRRRGDAAVPETLSTDEQARLKDILDS